MQDWRRFQGSKKASLVAQAYCTPANFLFWPRVDPCASGMRHVLGTKADAEQGEACLKALFHKGNLFWHNRVAFLIPHANGTAEDNGKRDVPGKPKGPFDSDQQVQVETTLSRGPMFSEVR